MVRRLAVAIVIVLVASQWSVQGQNVFELATTRQGPDASGQQRLAALAKLWRDAEDDKSEQQRITEMAAKMLSAQFEADLERREAELKRIEERVDRLRRQLNKRAENKEEIVKLQIKQLTMSWDGLGWNEPSSRKHDAIIAMPNGLGQDMNPMFFPSRGENETSSLLSLLEDAVAREDHEDVMFFGKKIVEQASEMKPVPANDLLWHMYQDVGKSVEERDFWLPAAKIAEQAAEGVENRTTRSNILDTAARLYHRGGDLEKALELQEEAVSLADHNFPLGVAGPAGAKARSGHADGDLHDFLDQLKDEKAAR